MIATILGVAVPLNYIQFRGKVLEIDALRAWQELELDSGWSNELVVKLNINPP